MSGKATDSKRQPAAGHSGPNEGEGSQTGARQYNESTKAFVASGKVKDAAEKAMHDVEGPRADELKKAEAEGKKHSHGEDPLLKR
jgi:hypothetical protein